MVKKRTKYTVVPLHTIFGSGSDIPTVRQPRQTVEIVIERKERKRITSCSTVSSVPDDSFSWKKQGKARINNALPQLRLAPVRGFPKPQLGNPSYTAGKIEKKNRQCKYGEECKRKDCVFLHPGEVMPPRQRVVKKPVDGDGRPFRKTRMCKYVKKCSKGKNCPFAHDESEIYVPECRYGYKCKKQVKNGIRNEGDCKFSHPPPPPIVEEIPEPEITFEFETENFPTVNGLEPTENTPTTPTIDFSCLVDEDYSQKLEEKLLLIEESKGKCSIGGSIDDMMKIFETMEGHDIYQYSFTF
jgi:hypothetical protein